MNILPLIALGAVALGGSALANPAAAPAPTAASTAGAVSTLTDAECLAIVNYMQHAERAAMEVWAGDWTGEQKLTLAAMQAINELPTEGLPDDFRRYMEEYGALVTASYEKEATLSRQLQQSNQDDAWDYLQQIRQLQQRRRDDKLALSARYYRASLLGSGWERGVYDRARTDLRLAHPRAKAFLEATPIQKHQQVDSLDRTAAYLQQLLEQPAPKLSTAEARQQLERLEILKTLDPTNKLEDSREFYAVHEGSTYAVRLPWDESTGCTWQLADPQNDALYSIEWQTVPTAELKKKKPHGDAAAATTLPRTQQTMVALVRLKKAATVILRFNCVRAGSDTPLVTKPLTFHVRRVDDYRPIMETDPLPEPPPTPIYAPGVASLTDNECLAIHRYLQKAYCYTLEECASSVEKQERVQIPVIAAGALPHKKVDALPQDFHDYLMEYHALYIRHRARSRELDSREYDQRFGKAVTKEERDELREERKKIDQQEKDMWEQLEKKYPRAIILRNASSQWAIDDTWRSYNRVDDRAKRFYAEHPDMKDATDKLSRAAYLRYLVAERQKEEQTFAAARRTLERLDALRLMGVKLEAETTRHFYGEAGDSRHALMLPLAPESGFIWSLASPLPEDSPVTVEWRQMEREKLQPLHRLGLIHDELPQSPQLSIATVGLQKKGETKLRFICTRPEDEEPLLTQRVETEARELEEEEDIPLAPLPDLPPAPQGEAATLASFSGAECLSLVNYIRRVKSVAMVAAADAIEMEENMNSADFARLASAELTDELPADVRDFVRRCGSVIETTQDKIATLETQLSELHKAEEENEEQEDVLRKQYRNILRQYRHDMEALEAAYPRAAFLRVQLNGDAASEVLCELEEESERSKAFLKANPKYKPGKRATAIAWLRHVAAGQQPEPTESEARATIGKLDLLKRLAFSNGGYTNRHMPTGMTIPNIFPHDAASGYSWQLREPLPEDAPVTLDWHTLPSAELRELEQLGVLEGYHDIPTAPQTTIATFRTVKAGKVTLEFIYSKPGEAKPLLTRKLVLEVKEDEED